MKLSPADALQRLQDSKQLFTELFKHGTLTVEVYKPEKHDHQKPHAQDEVYIVIAGSGQFYNNGTTHAFKQGDVLFVPAGTEHHFESFTDDFSTWVIFYGPQGGEKA